jgi:hypothetical protein
MKILIWNVRGLNSPFKQREAKKMLSRLKVSILSIVETRIKYDKAHSIKDALVPGWDWIHNCSTHCLGRIWICWDPGITSIQLISLHEQAISCKVATHGRGQWCFSGVYGSTNGIGRRV